MAAKTSVFRIALMLGVSSVLSASSIFNFDSDPNNKDTPFTETNNGLAATFASVGGTPEEPSGDYPSGVAEVFAFSGGVLSSGKALGTLYFGTPTSDITISFNMESSSISLDFFDDSESGASFNLTAMNNGIVVGTSATTSSILNEFPEGFIGFNATQFNSVQLTSGADGFAIDNVDVNGASSAPEPGTFALMLLGAVGILAGRLCAFGYYQG